MKKNFLLREKKYSTGLSKNRFTRSIQFPEWENGSVQAKIIKASVTYIPNLLYRFSESDLNAGSIMCVSRLLRDKTDHNRQESGIQQNNRNRGRIPLSI